VFWARLEVARALDSSETGEAFGEPAQNICHGTAPVGSAVKPGPSIPRPGHAWRGPVELLSLAKKGTLQPEKRTLVWFRYSRGVTLIGGRL
jgi:hypothetical protein